MRTKPVCILETRRLTPTAKFVPSFTLVENPIKGVCRDITKDEARAIVEQYNLQRFPVRRGSEDGFGVQDLGAVWDTSTQAFKMYWAAGSIPARLVRHFGLRIGENNPRRGRVRAWLFRTMHTYKTFLFGRIDKMFNE